jgi:protein PsiE
MVGIYFKTTRLPVRYLIYIAITALGRVLIEIGGAEHKTGEDLLVVAGAILVLSFAVLVLRFASHWDDPSDTPQSRTSVRSNMLTRRRRRAATRHLEPVFRS